MSDSLHNASYVENLENITRILLRSDKDGLQFIKLMWTAQLGKQEVIITNVFSLMHNLALDLSDRQVDWLASRLMSFWHKMDVKHQNRVLSLYLNISRSDVKEKTLHKLLIRIWNLAHSSNLTSEKVNAVLEVFVQIISFHYDNEDESPKHQWLLKGINEFKWNMGWEIPAMILIEKICLTFKKYNDEMTEEEKEFCRESIITRLQEEYAIIATTTNNLAEYVDHLRFRLEDEPELISENKLIDNYYYHNQQLEERLIFLR